jgi:aconitate hydratase 2/2-methylisocitrate dehydratase
MHRGIRNVGRNLLRLSKSRVSTWNHGQFQAVREGGFMMRSSRHLSALKDSVAGATSERAAVGIVPKPLDSEEVAQLCELLKNPPSGEEEFLLEQLKNRVPPGVDEAAYVKASFLTSVAKGEVTSPLVSKELATELLGTMQGGYNIMTLIELLEDATLGPIAGKALNNTLLMFDSFYDVETKAKAGNENAKKVMQSWADAEWFLSKPDFLRRLL